MFLDPVVVLVGAGASAEFGIPTGVGIYNDAKSENEDSIRTSAGFEDRFLSSFWEFLRFNNLGQEQVKFRQLTRNLRESHAYSIDLYAYYNPSDANIAKLYTTWRILKEHYSIQTQRDRWGDSRNILARSYRWRNPTVGIGETIRNNWMGELVNAMLAGAKDVEDLQRNNLSIVTFNYDAVVEETVPWIVGRYERFSDAPIELLPPVVHVHGSLSCPEPIGVNPKFYADQAAEIKFISDTLDQPSVAVTEAKRLLTEAHRVYCVGFAFEQLNLELLEGSKWGMKSVALNYDGNVKVTNAMKRIGLRSSDIWSGTDTKPMALGMAASRGFFDARPGQ